MMLHLMIRKKPTNEQILKREQRYCHSPKMDALGLKYSNLENKMQSATKIKGMPVGNVASKSVAPTESTTCVTLRGTQAKVFQVSRS